MPTRRMIDPAFWQSESMAELSECERLFFLGLISNADDQGRIRGHPALLRSLIYPFDDISTDEIERRIQVLSGIDCIFVYEFEGKKALQIVNWWQYQSPQWAYPSKTPPPPGWSDRLRYRENNEVRQDGWDGAGGFEVSKKSDGYANLGKGMDKPLGKALPKPIAGPIEIGIELDIESTTTGADKKFIERLLKVCNLEAVYLTDPGISELNQTALWLRQAGADISDLDYFEDSYWWGKTPATLGQVKKYWAQCQAQKRGKTNGSHTNGSSKSSTGRKAKVTGSTLLTPDEFKAQLAKL